MPLRLLAQVPVFPAALTVALEAITAQTEETVAGAINARRALIEEYRAGRTANLIPIIGDIRQATGVRMNEALILPHRLRAE